MNAGANTNRTSLIDNGTTTASYCYDTADRLVSTTQLGYGSVIGYDDHGNTTSMAGESLAYDGADRHTSTSTAGVTVSYTRDVTDRIVARTGPAAGPIPVWRGAGTAANNGAGSTSLTLARPAAAVAGDMMLAVVASAGATVTAPSGWTVAGVSSNTGVTSTVLWRAATAADPASWTFTLDSSQKATGQIVAYSGVHATAPIDITRSAVTVSGTAHAAPRVVTGGANRMVLTVAAVAADTSFTPSASTTERVDTAGTAGAPSVSVEVAQAGQAPEAKSALRTPVSAVAAVGATLTIALRPADSGTETVRYSYSAGGDGTALTLTTTNVVIDQSLTLPGGLVLTRRSATHNTWAYPNIHGDVTFTLDHNGQMTGPFLYDPYGQPLTADSNTGPGDFDNGWVGQHQRPTEHQPGLRPTIEMGARPYRPELGRFLRIDPIPGGCSNAYAYVDDPINQYDLNGQKCPSGYKYAGKKWRTVASGTSPGEASVTVSSKHLAMGLRIQVKANLASMAGVEVEVNGWNAQTGRNFGMKHRGANSRQYQNFSYGGSGLWDPRSAKDYFVFNIWARVPEYAQGSAIGDAALIWIDIRVQIRWGYCVSSKGRTRWAT